MYNDIGRKLKRIANVLSGIVIGIACISGLVLMFTVSFWIGLLEIVGGIVIGWCGFAMLYAIGELVDNSTHLRADLEGVYGCVDAIYQLMPGEGSTTTAEH